MNKKKPLWATITLRILALPFVVGIIFIFGTWRQLHAVWLFLRYGGELISYQGEDQPMIYDIWDWIKEQRKRELAENQPVKPAQP